MACDISTTMMDFLKWSMSWKGKNITFIRWLTMTHLVHQVRSKTFLILFCDDLQNRGIPQQRTNFPKRKVLAGDRASNPTYIKNEYLHHHKISKKICYYSSFCIVIIPGTTGRRGCLWRGDSNIVADGKISVNFHANGPNLHRGKHSVLRRREGKE